jgi:hypothetical protein
MMMIFTADMQPKAIHQNKGKTHTFTCDFCGATADGVKVQPDDPEREAWAVLPEEWSEIEDRRDCAKKQFMTCCESSACQYEGSRHSD